MEKRSVEKKATKKKKYEIDIQLSRPSQNVVSLIRTPVPYKFESPIGYLLRLSEENKFANYGPIISLVTNNPEYVMTVGWRFTLLQSLLGDSELPQNFGYRSSRYIRGRAVLEGNALSTNHIGMIRSRICPQCVKDLGYIPSTWDLKAYVACHIHKRMMLKQCPHCLKRIKSKRAGLLICQCGFDFSYAETKTASDEVCAISEILHAIVTRDNRSLENCEKLGFPSKDFLLMDIDVFCKMLMGFSTAYANLTGKIYVRRRYVEITSHFENIGISFSNWPDNFYNFLRLWREHDRRHVDTRNQRYFQMCFSLIFITFYKNLKKDKNQTIFLLKAAYEYGFREWDGKPIIIREKTLKGISFRPARFGNFQAAADAIGFTIRQMIRKFNIGEVPNEFYKRISSRTVVFDVDALREATCFTKKITYGAGRAAKVLGIPASVVMYLQKIEKLNFEIIKNYNVITLDDIEAYKKSIFNKATKANKTNLIQLSKVFRSRIAIEQTERLLSSIISGEQKVYLQGNEKLISQLLVKSDVIKTLNINRQEATDETCVCSVGKRFGINQVEAKAICIFLGGELSSGRFTVRTSSVNKFFSEYVPLREILIGTSLNALSVKNAMKNGRGCEYVLSLPVDTRENNQFATFIKKEGVHRALLIARKIMNGNKYRQ